MGQLPVTVVGLVLFLSPCLWSISRSGTRFCPLSVAKVVILPVTLAENTEPFFGFMFFGEATKQRGKKGATEKLEGSAQPEKQAPESPGVARSLPLSGQDATQRLCFG